MARTVGSNVADSSLEALGLSEAPRADWRVYPGVWPTFPGVLHDGHLLRLHPAPSRRLGKWMVNAPAGGFEGDEQSVPVNYLMLRANEAEVGGRYPVLAVGSNGSPAQLKHKMDSIGLSSTIPMVRAKVTGIGIGVSAYVSPMGYVSSSPFRSPDEELELLVTWLDANQLAVVDDSEGVFDRDTGGEYDRVFLPGADFPVVLPSGEILGGVYCYVHRWGVLKDPETGEPRPHPGVLDAIRGGGVPTGQRTLMDALLAESPRLAELFGGDADEFSVRARGNDKLAMQGTVLFKEEGRSTASGLEEYVTENPETIVYDDIQPANQRPPGTYRVGRTSNQFERRGVTVVRISPQTHEELGRRPYALIQHAPSGHARRDERRKNLGVLAKIVVAQKFEIPDGVIQVDMSARVGLGIEPGENLVVRGAVAKRKALADRLFPEPNYVVCRVQDGDRTHAEHEVALLDELSLELLSTASGDDVVIEGFPDADGVVPTVRLKAVKTSDAVRDQRKELHGGDLTSRYPSARDAVGSFPDLPWVFLDRRLWWALGLEEQKMAVVRIRSSRSHQLKKELREMLLLLALAFIGIAEVVEAVPIRWLMIVVLALAVSVTVVVRLRGRLSERASVVSRHRPTTAVAPPLPVPAPREPEQDTASKW